MASVSETTYPPLFRRHARRPRLTRLLDESTAQAILITAPAGYGKTTLAAEWLQGRDDAVWYRATTASADLAAFSAGVAEVVAPLVPGAGERLRQRLRVAEAPEKAVRPLAELLAQDMAVWPKDAWLVIDDYHLVADSTPVEEFVDWLLTLSPIRLLVTTRRRPIWASARRILYGEITEIGREQLAMTNEEAARVLDGRSSDAVRALVTQAEGWPALIGLAALSASSELPEERVSEALFRYFAEEVFRREPEEVQQFMLVASVPPWINERVVREVLRIRDSDALLYRLHEQGLLQGATPEEFRFHPLLRDYLRAKIEREDSSLTRTLSNGSIADARVARRWADAFELAIETRQLRMAAEIVGEAAPDLLAAGRVETISKWLDLCGPAAHTEPTAVLARTETLIRQGRFSEAAVLSKSLSQQLPADDVRLSRACYLTGQAFHLSSDEMNALRCHLAAKRVARTPIDQANALWGAFLAAAEMELASTSNLLDELASLTNEDVDGRLRLATGQVLAAARAGSYATVTAKIDSLVPLAQFSSDPMIETNFLVRAADTYAAQARYDVAHALSSRAVRICKGLGLHFATALSLDVHARTEMGLRQFAAARRTIDEIARHSRRGEDPYLELARRVLRLRLLLAEGAVNRTSESFGQLPSTDVQKCGQGEYWALLAIVDAVRGETSRARERAELARSLSRAIEPLYFSRFAELMASVREVSGDLPEELIETGVQLIEESARARFFDALVVAYRAEPRILLVAKKDDSALSVVRAVIARTRDHAIARKCRIVERDGACSGIGHSLTPREVDVLSLMSQGFTNRQIADSLFISPSTVKVHVHHILAKLGTTSRLQAVLQSQDLLTP